MNKGNKELQVAGIAEGPTASRDPKLDSVQNCSLSTQVGSEPFVTLGRLPDLCTSVS